ncbi:MAG: MFS transporter [Owenweeksia sp.]
MRNKPLLVLFITIFIDLLGFGIIIPILPIYANELGAPGWVIGLIAASFSFMQFLFAPFWGRLSDRIGRRPVLLYSILLVAISYLVFAHAGTIALLFAARMLAGIGAANISTANAFVSDISNPDNRARNFGIIGAAFGLGFIFGPPLGGLLKTSYGIEWVGYVAAILAGLNLLMAFFMLPESNQHKTREGSFFPNPFKEMAKAFPRRDIRSFLLIQFVFMTAFSMLQITASLMWEEHFGLTEAEIGYSFAFVGVSIAVIQGTLIGRLTKHFGEHQLFIAGHFFMFVGLLSLPFVPDHYFIPLEMVALLCIAIGMAFFTPTLSSLLAQAAGENEQGKVMGLLQSTGSLSRVIGPFTGGALYGYYFFLPYLTAALMMLLTASIAIYIVHYKQPLKKAPPEEAP